jgi:hypothetical protein
MDPSLTVRNLAEPDVTETVDAKDPLEELEKRFRNGASWFYWVAILSLVNSAVALFDGEWGFVFGLGFTQVVDAIAATVAEESPNLATASKVVGFGADVLIVGVVALMGWLAHKRLQWVFVVGLVLYVFDALLFLMAGDFLGLAFHGWVFFAVTGGLLACRKLASLESPPVEQAFSPA